MLVEEPILLNPSLPSQTGKLRGLRLHLDANIRGQPHVMERATSVLLELWHQGPVAHTENRKERTHDGGGTGKRPLGASSDRCRHLITDMAGNIAA